MNRPTIRIYTASNEFIDRLMNDDEFAQHKKDVAKWQEEKAEAEAKATAKEALLDRLGITADEAKLLLS